MRHANLLFVLLLAGCPESPAPTPPARGVPFTDSVANATIVRITDKTEDGYSGNGIQNEYARADAYNCDGTRVMLRSNDGALYLYDATTYRPVSGFTAPASSQEPEPRWSDTDPNVFFYLSGPFLRSYNISTQDSALVHDFRHEFPNCGLITTGVEGDASTDRRIWGFIICDSMFNHLAVCTYDRTQNQVLGQMTQFPDAINHVTIDESGSHIVIGYDSRPFQSFHPDFTHQVDFATGAAGHADCALLADSTDVLVYQNVATDSISMTDLETGIETGLHAIPFDVNPDIGMHISGNCTATPGWVLVSTYGGQNPPAGSSHSWMDNLLYLLELRSNPTVRRLCHTNCYTGREPRPNYFAECFASINRAGTRVVFGSNWGDFSPEDYTEAYELRVP